MMGPSTVGISVTPSNSCRYGFLRRAAGGGSIVACYLTHRSPRYASPRECHGNGLPTLPPHRARTSGDRNSLSGECSVWNAMRAGTPAARDKATNELALPMQKATPWGIPSRGGRCPPGGDQKEEGAGT